MKKVFNLQFAIQKSIFGLSRHKLSYDKSSGNWVCHMCGTANGGYYSYCDDCGHSRCARCSEM